MAVVGLMPQFASCHFLINLWCIFCAEEFQPIILLPKKTVLEQLTTKLLNEPFTLERIGRRIRTQRYDYYSVVVVGFLMCTVTAVCVALAGGRDT